MAVVLKRLPTGHRRAVLSSGDPEPFANQYYILRVGMSSPCATVAFKIFAVFCIIAIQGPLVHALGSVYGYPINYCGNKTDQVIESFEEALYFVESNVLEDVKKVRSKTQPRDAFLTYFKGIRLKVPVAKLFSDMVDVQRPEQQNLETNKFRIYCLTEDAPDPVLVYAYQEACTVYEDTEAAYSSDIPNDQGGNVLLCPAFFDLPLFPRPHNECPRIRNNTMENNANLSLNRLGAVVHELAHAHGAVDESTDVEVYYDQDAADLFPSDQLRNAQNYALYAACT
ncbi:uncharacterized protein KY384_002829 [Bacidia gigantensis]|uniref:uncharacterized protein n=1 Tax=Bacidia gigantensis TaxID=2732470 RepID=UPI001D037309|nr:uncharacterized protein KY384_002829 [Bacidia gigantensis]KAG8532951.1 hypothetical protein KY384_002829 [Bacidia gigantensis]